MADRVEPPAVMCEHHECRCFAAAKLGAMGLTAEAVEVHWRRVRCIKGSPDAWATGDFGISGRTL